VRFLDEARKPTAVFVLREEEGLARVHREFTGFWKNRRFNVGRRKPVVVLWGPGC
jgi:hypothetical protein